MSLLTPPLTPDGVESGLLSSKSEFGSLSKTLDYPSSPRLLTPPESPGYDSVLAEHDKQPLGRQTQSRQLSDNELSYYLPSRGDGVNDMYLHHRLRAPVQLMKEERIVALWAYQLLKHPLLASSVQFNSYEEVDFVHQPPSTIYQAIQQAQTRFSYATASPDENILDEYLNGPRTLSNQNLSYLFIRVTNEEEYEIMLCATHFLGDGMALHTFMNEFYTLLGSDKSALDILEMINTSLQSDSTKIPTSMEDKLPKPSSEFKRIIGADEYLRSEKRLVGGQGFPRNPKKMERKTVVPTFAYTPEETKMILGNCKKNGVTIAHAVFALCNLAWARLARDQTDPCLIYSALNMRTQMTPSPSDSYFHLAVGYFNVVLPTLTPSSITPAELFWHRARMTKSQTVQAVKSPFVVSRSLETSKIRKSRAVKWARIDDEEEAAKAMGQSQIGLGLGINMPEQIAPLPLPSAAKVEAVEKPKNDINTPTPQAVNQKALMGLSMLGNLDGMYKHAQYPDIHLTSLTTGSRQRPGALLLFAYTFAGKLWFSLGYDTNGFKDGVIEQFWEEVQKLVREILL